MKPTLKDFLKCYDTDSIQLIYGCHIVNIDKRVEGSFYLMCTFLNIKFDFVSYNEKTKHLILKY